MRVQESYVHVTYFKFWGMEFLSRGNTDGEILAFCLSPALLQLWQFLEFWPCFFLLPVPQDPGDFNVQENVVMVTIGLYIESEITNTLWHTLSACNETLQERFHWVCQPDTVIRQPWRCQTCLWNNPFFLKSCSVDSFHRLSSLLSR